MRRIIFLLCISLSAAVNTFAQMGKSMPIPPDPTRNRDSLPYKLNPMLPAFNIMLSDSSTLFNTFNIPRGRKVAIMAFSPDCKHCAHLTQALTAGMDSLKDIDFYMVTPSRDFTAIRKFAKEHQLDKYPNIKAIGCDYEIFFLYHFGSFRIPDIALFGKDRKLLALLESDITVSQIYEAAHRQD
ncbi:MAG: hypothetical protein K9G49_02125 [Taibaiella sp.]|nr:hypothetical protein [Taibaiella sp.]